MTGLHDPALHSFPPDQRAAIEMADAMTQGSGAISDELFERLSRHFNEAQIVEMAAVIGLFNYFNRFNNMFQTEITLMDPDVLIHRVEEALANEEDPAGALKNAVAVLAHGRRYASLALFRVEGARLALVAIGGHPVGQPGDSVPVALRADLVEGGTTRIIAIPDGVPGYQPMAAAARSVCVVPVRKHDRLAGALIAEQERPEAFNDEDEEDRRLLEGAAVILGRLL